VLDSSLGFSVSRMVLTKFQTSRAKPKEPEVETEPQYETPSVPLALAAHASSSNGDSFDAPRDMDQIDAPLQ
jgi:hypothetical protein